jgi:phasin family protein
MADETQTVIDATADAAVQATEAVGEAAKKATVTAVKAGRRAATATRRTKREPKVAAATAKTTGRTKTRRTKKAAAAQPRVAKERINTVAKNSNDWFASFGNLPTAAPFQALFSEAGERGQQAVKRSQKAVEELAEVSKANVEALVDAGKIAVEGARSIGQDVVETSREGIEQAADAVRALAEAKSPTEFLQLQSEFARAQFDRFVAESSRLTESFVKLAGEAIQPIQSRATLNAERINKLVA